MNGFPIFQNLLNNLKRTLSEVKAALNDHNPELAEDIGHLLGEMNKLGQGRGSRVPSSEFRRLSTLFNRYSQTLNGIEIALGRVRPELAAEIRQLRNELNQLDGGE